MTAKDLIEKYEKHIKSFRKQLISEKIKPDKDIQCYANMSFLEIKIKTREKFITDLKELDK